MKTKIFSFSRLPDSIKVGTFWQIPVKIHWTFGLLLVLLIFSAYKNGFSLHQTIGFILFFLCVFLCVLLHEYGHALMAKKFNVKTRDIILSPIGGVARLERLPKNPYQELSIAIAGPLVNLIIAAVLIPVLYFIFKTGWPRLDDFNYDKPLEFFKYLAFVNAGLFIFNLIPAFPMDGGRILRAILAMNMNKVRATKIASQIGKLIAIIFIISGVFFQHLALSFIGIFIFLMAGMEYKSLRMAELMKNTTAGQLMRTRFSFIFPDDSYDKLIQLYKEAGEKNFLVFTKDNDVIGTVPELFIKDVMNKGNYGCKVSNLMSPTIGIYPSHTSLEFLMMAMKEKGLAIAAIEEEKIITGVIDRQLIQDFIILKSS